MSIAPSDLLLTDRVAVVTGGGAGIGRGIAAGLAAFGARVAIWERDAGTCASAADEVGALGITTDVRDSAQVDAALAQTVAELGPVTILVNNAGGVFHSSILETSENGWDALYKANLRHVYLCTQRIARGIVDAEADRQHHQRHVDRRGARRTRVRDLRGGQGRSDQLHQDRRTRTRAARHPSQCARTRPHDDRRHQGDLAPGTEDRVRSMVPMGRAGHVDEMAGAAVFLASEMSSYITGQTIHVDGGTQAASRLASPSRNRRVRARRELTQRSVRRSPIPRRR